MNAVLQMVKRKMNTLFTSEELLRPSQDWGPIIHRDYIQDALEQKNATVILENFQAIDQQSLGLIFDLIPKLKRVSWFFEITSDEDDACLFRLYDVLLEKFDLRVCRLRLNPIPLDEILSSESANSRHETIRAQYLRHKGNLRVIIDAATLLQRKGTERDLDRELDYFEDPTVAIIRELDHSSFFLLTLIIANDSQLELQIAKLIFQVKSPLL
jgi:hypothetical protein